MISSVNCHSSKILEHVDYHLQLTVREIPYYIKDASKFLRKLKPITEIPENSYLVTLDVKSLYTSIPSYGGKKAIKISHESFTKKTNYLLSSHCNLKQFYIQLKTLSTNQWFCNGNYLRNILGKYKHPKSLKDSLPYSQAIQIKRINSNQVDLNNSLKEMENNFLKQGCHPSLIN